MSLQEASHVQVYCVTLLTYHVSKGKIEIIL